MRLIHRTLYTYTLYSQFRSHDFTISHKYRILYTVIVKKSNSLNWVFNGGPLIQKVLKMAVCGQSMTYVVVVTGDWRCCCRSIDPKLAQKLYCILDGLCTNLPKTYILGHIISTNVQNKPPCWPKISIFTKYFSVY